MNAPKILIDEAVKQGFAHVGGNALRKDGKYYVFRAYRDAKLGAIWRFEHLWAVRGPHIEAAE